MLKWTQCEDFLIFCCLFQFVISMFFEINSKYFTVNLLCVFCFFFLFSTWVFFQEHSPSTGLQGKGEGIYLTPLYHFQPLHRYLDISREITAEVSPLHIASCRSRIRNLWFPSPSLLLLMYVLSYIGCNVCNVCTNVCNPMFVLSYIGCNWSDVLTIATLQNKRRFSWPFSFFQRCL